MPRLGAKVAFFLVVASLLGGVVLNVLVSASCEFLTAGEDRTLSLGVYRYSLDDPNNPEWNTNGECQDYSAWQSNNGQDDIPKTVQTAQICALIAPCCGVALLFLVFLTQCWFPVPCSGIFVSLFYLGAQGGTALVWLLRRNDLCDNLLGGCEWGEAAKLHLSAQLCYLVASICHECLPDPKQQERQQSQQDDDSKKDVEDGGAVAAVASNTAKNTNGAAVASASSSSPQVTQLQGDLVIARQRVEDLQTELEVQNLELQQAQQEASEYATEVQKLERENEQWTTAASTAAAVEARKIQTLEKQLEAKQEELDQATATVQLLEQEDDRTKLALAKATQGNDERIEMLEDQLEEKQQEVELAKASADEYSAKVQELLEEQQKEINAAAVVTTTTTTDDRSAEMTVLQNELDEQTEELDRANALVEQYAAIIEALEAEQQKDAAPEIAAAAAAAETADAASAVKIERLQQELQQQREQFGETQATADENAQYLQDELDQAQALVDQFAARIATLEEQQQQQQQQQQQADAAATSVPTPTPTNDEIEQLQRELQKQKEDFEQAKATANEYTQNLQRMEQESLAKKNALEERAAQQATQIEMLQVQLDRQRKEAEQLQDELEALRAAAAREPEQEEEEEEEEEVVEYYIEEEVDQESPPPRPQAPREQSFSDLRKMYESN